MGRFVRGDVEQAGKNRNLVDLLRLDPGTELQSPVGRFKIGWSMDKSIVELNLENILPFAFNPRLFKTKRKAWFPFSRGTLEFCARAGHGKKSMSVRSQSWCRMSKLGDSGRL